MLRHDIFLYDYLAVGSGNFLLGFAKHNEQFYFVTLFKLVTVPKKVKGMNYMSWDNSPDR